MAVNNAISQAKLRRLKIEKFRGIDDLELSFLDPRGSPTPLMVLAGPNGSGKTRAIEACLMALGRFDLVRREWVRKPDRLRRPMLRSELRPAYVGAHIFVEIEGQDGTRELALSEHEIVNGLAGPRLSSGDRAGVTYFSSWRGPRLIGAVPIELERTGPSRVRDEDRLVMIKQYLVNAKAHGQMVFEPSQNAPITNAPTPKTYDMLMARLADAWAQFRPEKGEYFSAEPISDDPGAGFDVFLRDPSPQRIPLDSLSSGELEVFTFLGWMVTNQVDQDIILIDEPELHLDPQWHALVLRAFQRLLPKTQFIVATHSPRLYQSVFEFQRKLLVPRSDPRAHAWGENGRPKNTHEENQTGAEL